MFRRAASGVVLSLLSAVLWAQSSVPQTNASALDPDGTVHITRVIPVPPSLSPEAKAFLRRPDTGGNDSLAERRAKTDAWQARAGEASRKAYPVNIKETTIAGVPVRYVTPLDATPPHPDRVLINVHGGGFNSDSGSLTESLACRSRVRWESSPGLGILARVMIRRRCTVCGV
jgi:epsilon-lactone hydrolase